MSTSTRKQHRYTANGTINYATQTYSDLGIGFKLHPITKDVLKITGSDTVKQSIVNLLNTNKYDRLMQPGVGSMVKQFLFEPISVLTTTRLKSAVEETITALEPRAELIDVIVEPSPDDYSYKISIIFSVVDEIEPIHFETYLQRYK
jgi:uncharacterized protein